ncbi:VOC family protein [Amycolatopsis aidingensis]|uniref:VOC family protein n=1 Tax=Amycolatopsis aidingensis TaxID=2842453 RepID=UPI001C0B1CBB|nr:VOC family protein [Amycolatopsis aidingensis]
MSEGNFVAHELRVPDVAAGAAFYGDLFGWTATDSPTGRQLRAGHLTIGGVSRVKDGIPAHWSGCVAVTDVLAAVDTAVQRGATVTTPTGAPVDLPGQGKLAPMLDPARGFFLLAEPAAEVATGTDGTFAWHRLYATDPAAAIAFYQAVLPWRAPVAGSHRFLLPEGKPVAEVVRATGTAQHWLPYVLVNDLEAACSLAAELGATVHADRHALTTGGRSRVIVDPQGAELGLCANTG